MLLKNIRGTRYKRAPVTGWTENAGNYNVQIDGYDLNGNIKHLTRWADHNGAARIDDLSYTYGTQGNQLQSVADGISSLYGAEGFNDQNAGTDYDYDENGNMVKDLNKEIDTIFYNYLNLPERVVKLDGQYIKYIYDAAGIKLAQEVYDASDNLIKKTEYIGEFIYEDSELALIQHEEGRIVPDEINGGWEYQYHLKDHLGNTRVTFTTKPKTLNFTANYEGDASNPDDIDLFEDVTISSMKDFNRTTGSSAYDKSQILYSSPNSQLGSAIAIPVGAGDKITATAYAKYIAAAENTSVSTASLSSLLVSAFTGSPAVNSFEGGTGTINNNFNGGSLIGGTGFPYDDANAPKAFLNMMFLPDGEAIDLVKDASFAYDQMSDGATESVLDGISDSPFDELKIENFEAPDNGYILVYVSNEGSLTDIHFDDIRITVEEHPVIQRDDYYPFGMAFNSWQREATSRKNDFLFNGIERETELDLGWDLAHYRAYDPAIGRWLQIDPKASERESPYVGFANRPNFYIDPLGDTVRLVTGDDPRTNDGATYRTDEVVITGERIEEPSIAGGFKEYFGMWGDLLTPDEPTEIGRDGNTEKAKSDGDIAVDNPDGLADDNAPESKDGNYKVVSHGENIDKNATDNRILKYYLKATDPGGASGDSAVTYTSEDKYPTLRGKLNSGGFTVDGREIKNKKDSAGLKWKLGNRQWKGYK